MRHEYENPEQYNTTFSRTGERVQYIRKKCKCGHTMNFMSRNKAFCSHCGRVVYPDAKYEFEDKLKKEMKKHEHSSANRSTNK